MTTTTYNMESLNRHGVLPTDADEVMAIGIWQEMPPSEQGNDRLMFIGFTAGGRLLEVGVEYFDDQNIEHVFHANDATNYYRALFQKRTATK